MTATPVRLENGFEWEIFGNYSKNNSMVEDLYGDLETIVLDELLRRHGRGQEG